MTQIAKPDFPQALFSKLSNSEPYWSLYGPKSVYGNRPHGYLPRSNLSADSRKTENWS
jgi:hypothetical protein